ncbi:MAG: ABC transporter permease [Longimicrobiales bacterium]
MLDWLHDLRIAARSLLRSPGFTAAAILTLALGIGATTAIFSAVNTVLLRPLPYPDPHELVRLYDQWRGERWTVSPPNFVDYRSEASFAGVTAYHRSSFTLTDPGEAEQIEAASVTSDFFRVLGSPPALGRGIVPENEAPGSDRVVVLSDGFWHQRFNADPGVLGRQIELDGERYTVVGVARAGFDYPSGAELWVPRSFTAEDLETQRGAHYLDVIGRLAPGATLVGATSQLEAISTRLARDYPDQYSEIVAVAVPMLDAMVGDYRRALFVLLGAVGLLLLMACVNAANLALARALGRQRELAVRAALGAGRWRLAREALGESLIVALVGGALGVLLAAWAGGLLAALQADRIPRLGEIGLDTNVLGFALLVSVLTGILFGLLPALRAGGRRELTGALKEGTAGAGSARSAGRVRGGLVVAQFALAVVLAAGAALLMRSFIELRSVDPGFRTEGILTFDVSLPESRYPEPWQARAFYERLLASIEALPGVVSADAISGLPLSGSGYSISVEEIDGAPAYTDPSASKSVQIRVATAGYFRTLGIGLLRGEGFETTLSAEGEPVTVLNESAAELLWPNQDALGHTLRVGTGMGLGLGDLGGRVVGIVSDVREYGPTEEVVPTAFVAHAQFPVDELTIAARTAGDPASLAQPIRRLIAAQDADLAMADVQALDRMLDVSLTQPRFYTLLLGGFAAAALLLAAVGIYGVLAYAVGQRRRELGIRLALGAGRRRVLGLVLRSAGGLAAAGLVIGVVATIGLTGLLRGMLYGLSPTDPVALGGAIVVLGIVALAASVLPAQRATRVDPMVALRQE